MSDTEPEQVIARLAQRTGELDPDALRGLVDACRGALARRGTVLLATADSDADPGVTRQLVPPTELTPPAIDSAPSPDDAERLGRYPIEGRLGAGGMGEVLAVHDLELDRVVAAKVIREPADERQRWKFALEARITGRLAHPSIVPVYELGHTDDGRPYFTMKRVEGRTLSEVLSAPPSSSSPEGAVAALDRTRIDRLGIALKVCDAVAFAHSQGVIHRDLKPDNVLVGDYGEVLVCDWGVAKVLRESASTDLAANALVPVKGEGEAVVTLDGTVMGTPAYMPPEQAQGRLDLVDERADVYALGAILYQVLCGWPPYVGRTAWSVIEQVCAGPPKPPSARAPGAAIPWELEAVVAKAMAYRREDRYPSAKALRDDLDAFLAGRLLAAARYTPVQRARKWARRHARALAAGIVALVSLIGALGYTAIAARRQVRELEAKDAITRAAERTAQHERDLARASYNEARRMGAVHRLRELERACAEELWWTRLDSATGTLRDAPTTARLEEAARLIDRGCGQADAMLGEREGHAAALAAGQAEAAAAPEDAWASFRAGVLIELMSGLDRLAALRDQAAARRVAYLALRDQDARRASVWTLAREAIARHPRYGGLLLEPQAGLVPLGENPTTGLWEFGVVGSGELPARTADGSLAIEDDTAVVLVLVPGGSYTVGAQPEGGRHTDPVAQPNEGPENAVSLRPYLIARTELTQHQWTAMGEPNPSRHVIGATAAGVVITGRNPVETASWITFAAALARRGLVLPSEAQWEVAARAGRATPWWTGPEAHTLARAENIADASARRLITGIGATEVWDDGYVCHAPVASYPQGRNPFGLYDVHGNVREWCRDPYGVRAGTWPADVHGDRAEAARDQRLRAYRGGSWFADARLARASNRSGNTPVAIADTLGARPARVVTGVGFP